MRNLAGKVAFITGGANGIGLGMAKAFTAAGMKVAIADIDMPAASRASETLGNQTMAVRLDVADLGAWEAAAREVEAAIGPVRVLCNNAGIASAQSVLQDTPVENISAAEWCWVMSINLTGPFYGIKTFLPRFKATQEPTHIVHTASLAGIVPQSAAVPGAYTVSKYGAVGLCEQLRLELESFPRIGLSVVCPGVVQTQIQSHTLKNAPYASNLDKTKRADNPYSATLSSGMSPDRVGQRVLKGIINGDFYIFTHPEYKPLVERYHSEIVKSFGASAQPGYTEPLPAWLPVRRSSGSSAD
jgi:NAD(P)-dependent dehydrogenase (short-subunit alcohol dehydrogenase family)